LKQDQIGTLEPGKLADLVLMDDNPLTDIHDLLKVVTTIQGGEIVSGTQAARQ
jgi:imidazolonepropionase-like amidohydrolase